jgi:c-di-GMP-binding flagellar brake protein YcgR
MLQRRSHFRVETPQGSMVTFRHNKKKCKFKIQDVSAGGMQMFEKETHGISLHGKEISEILISIPVVTTGPDAKLSKIRFAIPRGKVVRSIKNKEAGVELFGVHFQPEPKEEARILKYVRQRELHLLRKGM